MRLNCALLLVLCYLIFVVLGIIGVSIWSLVVFTQNDEHSCCIPPTCSTNVNDETIPHPTQAVPKSSEICTKLSTSTITALSCSSAYDELFANIATCNTTSAHSCFTPHSTGAKPIAIVGGVCGLLSGIGLFFGLKRRITASDDEAVAASSSVLFWFFGLLGLASCILSLVTLNIKGGSDVKSVPAIVEGESGTAVAGHGNKVNFGTGCGSLSGKQAYRLEVTTEDFTPVLAILATFTGLPSIIFFAAIGLFTNYCSQSENNPFQIVFLWWHKRVNDDGSEKFDVDENGQNIRAQRSGYVSAGLLVEVLLKNSKDSSANGAGSGLIPETAIVQTLSPTTQALFFQTQQMQQRKKLKSDFFPEYSDSLADSRSIRGNNSPLMMLSSGNGNNNEQQQSHSNGNSTGCTPYHQHAKNGKQQQKKMNRGEETVMGTGMVTDNETINSKSREGSMDREGSRTSDDSPFRSLAAASAAAVAKNQIRQQQQQELENNKNKNNNNEQDGSSGSKYPYRNERTSIITPPMAIGQEPQQPVNPDSFYKKKETWRPKVVSMMNPLMTTDDEGMMSSNRKDSSSSSMFIPSSASTNNNNKRAPQLPLPLSSSSSSARGSQQNQYQYNHASSSSALHSPIILASPPDHLASTLNGNNNNSTSSILTPSSSQPSNRSEQPFALESSADETARNRTKKETTGRTTTDKIVVDDSDDDHRSNNASSSSARLAQSSAAAASTNPLHNNNQQQQQLQSSSGSNGTSRNGTPTLRSRGDSFSSDQASSSFRPLARKETGIFTGGTSTTTSTSQQNHNNHNSNLVASIPQVDVSREESLNDSMDDL